MKKKANKKRKKIMIISIVIVLVIGAVGTGFAMSSGKNNQSDDTTAFKTITATRGDVSLNVTASGNIEGSNSSIISSDVDALINSTEVSVGDYISEGDVLFGLDVEYLQDKLEDAEDQLENYNDTLNEKYESNDDLYVKAPVAGVVAEVNIKPGENASTMQAAYGSVIELATEAVMEAKINWAGYYEASDGEAMKVGVLGDGGTIDGFISEKDKTGYTVQINTLDYPEETYIDVYTLNDMYLGYGELYVPDEYAYKISGNNDVSAVYVTEGQWVSRGDKLFKYENSSISNQISDQKDTIEEQKEYIEEIKALIESPYIKSTTSGIVSKSYVNVNDGGAMIGEDDSLLEIVDGNALEVTVSVDELDVVTLEVGMMADVSIDALPDIVYEGELTDISRIGSTSGDITYYDAVVKLINPSEKILVGMSSSTEIKVQSVEDVVVVPVSALQYRGGSYFVYVPADEVPETASVSDEIQVLSARPNAENMTDEERTEMREKFENMTDEERAEMREQMTGGMTDTSAGIAVDESEAVLVPVEIGLMDEFYAEILSGISEGQTILIPSIAEDDSAATGMMMPGMMGGGTGQRPAGAQRPQ